MLKPGIYNQLMPGLILQIKKTIKEWNMLSRGDTVIAAVSGGADSVVMLNLLLELREELGLKVVVAHMDHGLRGAESRRDLEFVKALAKSLGLEFVSKRLAKGELKSMEGSPQDAARKLRYSFLEETAKRFKASKVATGHTLDDQAETVLMRLMKGSSLSGLTGIPPVRSVFIRPLIETSREQIEGYAKAKGISFVTDSSNLTTKYLRNSIRLELIPFIEEKYKASIKETLARTALILSHDDDFLEKAAIKAFGSSLVGRSEDQVVLDRAKLVRLHSAISSRVFLRAVHALGVETDAGAAHVAFFLEILKGKRPNASISLPGGMSVRREYGRMIISREALPGAITEVFLNLPGTTRIEGAGVMDAKIVQPPGKFTTGPDTAWFDYDALQDEAGLLGVRQARPGDRMTPFGMSGHRKLKDIFIDAKVPLPQRRRTPVVTTAGGQIIWVAGLRQSSLFSISKGTKRALRLDFIKEQF